MLVADRGSPASATEIREALEGPSTEAKQQALQKAIMMLLAGEQLPQLFITIVRYVLPSEDHLVQKLLLLYLVRAVTQPPAARAQINLQGTQCMARQTIGVGLHGIHRVERAKHDAGSD